MSFIEQNVNKAPTEDTAFIVAKKAKEAKVAAGAEQVVDVTIGSLYNEEGNVATFDSAFTLYNEIAKETKVTYAVSFIDDDSFRKQVYKWIVDGTGSTLMYSVIATPEGAGTVAITMREILDEGGTVILPEIAQSSYRLTAIIDNLKVRTYSLFEGDHLNVESLKEACREIIKTQKKLLLVIGNPCHNPTGYSMSMKEWQGTVVFLNECGKEVPVVLLDDITYIDFSCDLERCRNCIKTFDDFSENATAVIAFSCNKTLTSYGLCCGTTILLAQTKEAVRDVEIVFEEMTRVTWNNMPNVAVENFIYVITTSCDACMKEKAMYVEFLKKRSDIFAEETGVRGLDYYPYKEDLFVVVRIENNALRDVFHESLMKQHIYTVKVNKGIRVAMHSLSSEKCRGLVERMKEILDTCRQTHVTLA